MTKLITIIILLFVNVYGQTYTPLKVYSGERTSKYGINNYLALYSGGFDVKISSVLDKFTTSTLINIAKKDDIVTFKIYDVIKTIHLNTGQILKNENKFRYIKLRITDKVMLYDSTLDLFIANIPSSFNVDRVTVYEYKVTHMVVSDNEHAKLDSLDLPMYLKTYRTNLKDLNRPFLVDVSDNYHYYNFHLSYCKNEFQYSIKSDNWSKTIVAENHCLLGQSIDYLLKSDYHYYNVTYKHDGKDRGGIPPNSKIQPKYNTIDNCPASYLWIYADYDTKIITKVTVTNTATTCNIPLYLGINWFVFKEIVL
jgi:hypothetical protein